MNEQLSAISSAPETHEPLTAQMTGVRIARSALVGVMSSGPTDSPDPGTSCLKFTPAENTGSIAVSTTTRTRSS